MNKIDIIQNKDLAKILARVFIRDNTLLEDIHAGDLDITDNNVMKEFMKGIVDNMAALLFILDNNLLEDFLNGFYVKALTNSCIKEYDDPNEEKSFNLIKALLMKLNKKENAYAETDSRSGQPDSQSLPADPAGAGV